MKKKIALLTTAAVVSVGPASVCLAEEATSETTKEELVAQIADSAKDVLMLDQSLNIYSNIAQASRADTLPSHFDLRDRGVVPAVRDQGNLGICWSFASIAASEISLLTDLGMTAEEYQELNGEEMNLSEKHLAWFSTVPIQEEEDMSEDARAQVGEGCRMLDEDAPSSAHYNTGGVIGYASALFASGMGPMPEDLVPYTNREGTASTAGDWSLDESIRFSYIWELKDSSILPSPVGRDEEGNYVYNETATEMIKQELLKGRGVSIVYLADQAMAPDAMWKIIEDRMADINKVPAESIALFIKMKKEEMEESDLTPEEEIEYKKAVICYYLEMLYSDVTDENFEELYEVCSEELGAADDEEEELSEEDPEMAVSREAASREAAEKLGIDYEKFLRDTEEDEDSEDEDSEDEEAEEIVYMNTENYSQYIGDDYYDINHAVCIIGYDDEYSASNFLEGHQPPADGAWIVRNSWGKGYGNDGYFYLSYYDHTISIPETFEYVTDADTMSATGLDINEYDFMLADAISSCASQKPIYLANEFTVENDSVLSYVSAMTANLNTNVTVAVYLLDENSQSPIDGELLDIRTVDFEYAGYHRIPLSQHYRLPKGCRISVVQTQRYDDEDGRYYALPYTIAVNCAGSEVLNDLYMVEVFQNGVEGRIGRNESFVGIDEEWYDWLDMLDEVKEVYPQAREFVSFDNFSIKTYMYRLTDIEGEHVFGEAVPYAGGEVRLCTECGYSLVER